jgi:hypothetical protein
MGREYPEASRREIQTMTGTAHTAKSPVFTATGPRKWVGSGPSNERCRRRVTPLYRRGVARYLAALASVK